ncbi:MAG TPA: PAS domain S-box protein [candidate division Zixibacteria bacterium]|nr:PAS domain S-box protein [candidate division Zixibacteria bacterium]
MPEAIRVLIVADEPAEAESMIGQLRKSGFNAEPQTVNHERGFLAGLDASPDVILAVFDMSPFGAPEALRLVKERGLDVPLIAVTTAGSEEIAVTRMQDGPAGYVLKDRLAPLGPLVSRALDETRLRREKRAAEDLQRRLTAILEATPDCVLIAGRDGRAVYLNPAGRKLLGFGEDEDIRGFMIAEAYPPSVRPQMTAVAFPAAARDGTWVGETALLHRSGREIPVSQVIIVHKPSDGSVQFFSTIARDMTEREQAEEKLRLQSAALESAANAVVITDRDGTIAWVNPAFTRLTGYSPAEAIGRNPRLLKSGAHDRAFYEKLWRTILSGETWSGEMVNRRKDGGLYTEEQTITPVRDPRGEITHFIAIKQDITERKRGEAALRGREAAEAANRLKSEFLANMSHELRTPLNAIIGFAQLMHDGKVGPLSATHQEYLGDILHSAHHLLQLINDILDVAKIEAGKMEFTPVPVDLAGIAAEAKTVVQGLAVRKRIRLEVDVDPALTGVVADARGLKQVLYNYLSNAIKFTAEGGHVTLRIRPEPPDRFRIEVEDDGIGIRAQDIGKLFSEFQQLDSGSGKQYAGTGLGLALTRRLVEAQGGEVGVRSEFGKGSLFYAVLPRTPR